MKIVPAKDAHIPEIVELWNEFMDFHKNIDPRFPLSESAPLNWENHLSGLMNSQDACVLVAIDGAHLMGYCICQTKRYAPLFQRETYGEISDMAVLAKFRRKGIGTAMLGKVFEWFASRNVNRIELSVASRNQIGYSFWRKHGFQDYQHRLYLNR